MNTETWYETDYSLEIKVVEVMEESDHFIEVLNSTGTTDRRRKQGYVRLYWRTWAQAHEFLLTREKRCLATALKAVEVAQHAICVLENLTEPEDEL